MLCGCLSLLPVDYQELPARDKEGVRHFSYHYIDHLLGKTRKTLYGSCYSNITWPLLQEHGDNNLMNLFSQLLPR